jgi:4'-phosphopantetheinyl transferase
VYAITDQGVIDRAAIPVYWLLASSTYDPDDLGNEWLAPAEREYYESLKIAKRRRDWLRGRWAAKSLLQRVLKVTSEISPSFDEIEILKHADGWPQIKIPIPDLHAEPFTLSISHRAEYAFCSVMEGENQPLGVDIELIEPRSSGFVADYFTAEEQALLGNTPQDQRSMLVNAIWSGKEAALKAIRRGLAEDTRIVSCLPHPIMHQDSKWLPMRIIWQRGRTKPRLTGRWREVDGFVLTLATAV